MQRPFGITLSTILMFMMSVVGIFTINPHIRYLSFVIGLTVIAYTFAYIVLFHYWNGRNWARWIVQVDCLLQFFNLWNTHRWEATHHGMGILPIRMPLIVCKLALAIFLLVYLNTRNIRTWFRTPATDKSPGAPDTPAPHAPPAA